MFPLGRIGKYVIAAQVGMKLFKMARAAQAKRSEKKLMEIAPHRFDQADKAGIHKA